MLEIDLNKIQDNANFMINLCKKNNISVAGVVKCVNAQPDITNTLRDCGCEYISSSRIEQLLNTKNNNQNIQTMLIRMPMKNEIEQVIQSVDVSLNSELDTIISLNNEAMNQNKIHKVILMIDLGDLREGIIDEETAVKTSQYIETKLKNIKLYGVGTNLGCYGAIKPSVKNLNKLCEIAQKIEKEIGRQLDIISGGATTTLPLLLDGILPPRINNLRIGEAIIVGRDLIDHWGYELNKTHKDTMILYAEVVEIKDKPSHPIGEMFLDALGNKPKFEDKGIRKKALLAVGKQDFGDDKDLVCLDKDIEILGSSSDHLILDITDSKIEYEVGDIISFGMFYSNVLYLNLSEYVNKKYKKIKIKVENT